MKKWKIIIIPTSEIFKYLKQWDEYHWIDARWSQISISSKALYSKGF